jgi:hypothetical protein
MRAWFNSIAKYVGKSVHEKRGGKVSSSRISSYFMLGAIILTSVTFVVIELVNAFMMWKLGLPYVIPSEHIVIFGMILAHHLTLLGINKNAETKIESSIQEKLKALGKKGEFDETGEELTTEGEIEGGPEEEVV